MANPVRIYVLHHPDSKAELGLGEMLTNRIYDWFRLPGLQGISVYLRSMAEGPDKDWPEMPYRKTGDQGLEYIVPLVDAHMVRDPRWHGYLAEVAERCAESEKEKSPEWGMKMFPVALDSTAFNLPECISQMNFIRHGAGLPPIVVRKGASDEKAQTEARDARIAEEVEETLKHLTAALAHDLSGRVFRERPGERFKIFISYARADSTEEAKALRNYIQGQTQCLVFFDENDIGFGSEFGRSIDDNVNELSRALIVLHSDSYAERPWCRHEIDLFTRPRSVRVGDRKGRGSRDIHAFLPMLVVDNMRGPKLTRVVPELAQAPMVRWLPGRERLCFSTLMREVVMGLRDLLEARLLPGKQSQHTVVVNRLPGPLALARLPGFSRASEESRLVVSHPGYGLPLTELKLLAETFRNIRFEAFRDIHRALPEKMRFALDQLDAGGGRLPLFHQKAIAISTAYSREDLARIGYLAQHQDEALIYLLRPLIRLGADLLYGGKAPRRHMDTSPSFARSEQRNITLTLMQLMSSERRGVSARGKRRKFAPAVGPLLFNVPPWPDSESLQSDDEAAWINACHVHRVTPEDAGLPAWSGPLPVPGEPPSIGERRYFALVMTRIRQTLAGGFTCDTPGELRRRVKPSAFVFIGGATHGFKGTMPGVMEELLFAIKLGKGAPIYPMGGLGGATDLIAQALLSTRGSRRPKELTMDYYRQPTYPDHRAYNALIGELEPEEIKRIEERFEMLWNEIASRRDHGDFDNLFGNGLNNAQNRELLGTHSTSKAVGLVWEGMTQVFLGR